MKVFHLLFIGLIGLSLFLACQKDEVYTKPGARLTFSTDTLLFDTVFSAIGSATKALIVQNPYNQKLILSSISLAGGNNSAFRLNIDGIKGNSASNVEIAPNDSLYIFVEVTVNPSGQNSPMVIQDSIVFEVNDGFQDVDLVAFGQDYHLINGEYLNTQTWVNDKPYLVYNSMAVDTQQVLTIQQGCQIHFHHNSSLYVLGTLKVEGSLEEPVVFQGDRLEEMYEDIPGQWGYIHLLAGSSNNSIDYAIIKNSIIGIQVDTVVNASPCLRISHSEIKNVNAIGLFAQGSHVVVDNCLFSNCGQFCVALTIGGKYEFYQSTLANYWPYSNRVTPALVINNYYQDINQNIQIRPIVAASFYNCIVYGNRENEIVFDQYPLPSPVVSSSFNYLFDHCLVKVDPELDIPDEVFILSNRNKEPGFVSSYDQNFELDSLAFARDKGKWETGLLYPVDLKGRSRIADQKPDPGCFERVDGLGELP